MRSHSEHRSHGLRITASVAAALALTACSHDSSGTSSSSSVTAAGSSAVSSSSAPSPGSSSAASSSSGSGRPSAGATQGPAAAAPTRTGDPALILANEPVYAVAQPVKADAVDLTGMEARIRGDGVLFTGAGHAVVKAQKLGQDVTVVWMSDSYVIETTTMKSCQSACPSSKAPAGASQVLVIDPARVTQVGVDTPITK